MRRFLTLFTVLMLTSIFAFAQDRLVTGKVVDDKGNGVPAASIKIAGTNKGTSTDSDGSFAIKVKKGEQLVISSTGYESKTVPTDGQSFVGVTIATTSATMQEVVVTTATGQIRQKSSVGFSTATVKGSELTQAKATNIAQGLTGKVSGATFLQTNSGVFQDTRITLRGIRSLTGNNQPMLIVDGVPISLGYLNSINPNDIATADILKSAGSTAIYGSDGVNGAIVITTRRGSKNRPQVSVSHAVQFESINYMPQFQNRWGSGYAQDGNGNGTYEPHEQQSWGDEFDGSIRQLGDPGPNGEIYTQKYAYLQGERRRFYDVGTTNQTDVSFSTGDFYLSGQNVDIKGTVPGDKNTRRGITFKAEKEYNRFKASLDVRYNQQKYNVTTSNTLIWYGVASAPGQVPLTDFWDWRNDVRASPNGYYTLYLSNQEYTPYFTKDINRDIGKTDDIFGNIEFKYKAASWLNLTYRLGLSVSNTGSTVTKEPFSFSDYYFARPEATAQTGTTAAIQNYNDYSNRLTSLFMADFIRKFNKVGLNGTLGYSYRDSRSKLQKTGSDNLGKSQFLSIATRLGEPTVNVDNTTSRTQRFFGRVGFDYDRWLFLEVTGSYDMDSRLVPANKIFQLKDISFFYPGASASILLHEIIPGLKDNNTLNFFKVRGAIAKTGNVNISPFANEVAFSSGTFFPFGSLPGYQIGSTIYPNEGLKPEFVNTKEVGIELGFLKNRINLEATYYNQNNTDQVLNVQLSNTTGATSALLNAGKFTNKGLEFDLKLTPLVKLGEAEIDFKINYANQDSKITGLIDGVNELGIGNYNYAVVGSPAFVFKTNDYYRDSATGKVIVDPITGMPSQNPNLTQFGRTLPKHILGLNLSIKWKGFTLGAVAEYRSGNQIIADQLGNFLDDNGISARSGSYGRRAFVFPNSVYLDNGKYVNNTNIYTQNYGRLFYNNDINTDVTSNYLADGSFWKLRELTLIYDFPASIFKGKGIKGASIGFIGRNLFMWLPKLNQWIDPEFTANGNNSYTGNAVGLSTAFNQPPTRFMGANVTLNF